MESSARGMVMIMLENVSYWWEDGEIALNNINLEVKEGQFVLISRLIFFKAVRPSSHS